MRIIFWAVLAFTVFVGLNALEAQGDPVTDCNNNGQSDAVDISSGFSTDCNLNGIPDECDSAADPLADCNLNGILDACEPISIATLLGAFSSVISMSGDTLLVSDPFEPLEPGEVPEPPDPEEPPLVRQIEVYERQSNLWVLSDLLVPLDEEPEDGFGASLAIDGDVAAVGAPQSDSGRGAVYVFVRTETGWMQAAKLTAELPSLIDEYGTAVDVLGSDIIVGAPQLVPEDPNDPEQILPSGYAEIWSQTGIGWERTAHIHVTETLPGGEETGGSVALAEGGWAFIGAIGFASGSGRVHTYLDLGGTWMSQGSLAASDSIQNLRFGRTMTASGSTLVVSARNAPGGPPGSGPVGAVYTFDRTGVSWTQVSKTMSPHPDPNGYGTSVAISDIQLVVGEPNVDSSRGFAHLYRRDGAGWELRESQRPAGTLNGDRYGAQVSTNGNWTGVVASGLPALFMSFTEDAPDCDGNGIDDRCELTDGSHGDCNGNGIPDVCDISAGLISDCDGDGVDDACNLLEGTPDCNNNGIPDSCDIDSGSSDDCNLNGIPDDCETDCNENGIPDDCDLLSGIADCNSNSIPDSCDIAAGLEEDCDLNGLADDCELAAGASDCDENNLLDVCQIAGAESDCNANGIMDSCEIVSTPLLDCNGNFQIDSCDIDFGITQDCDENGVPDECQLTAGSSIDCNSNGILDECEEVGTTDIIPPVFLNLPANMSASADLGACHTAMSWVSPSASDNCGPPPMVSASHISGSDFPVGVTEVVFTAEDLAGNQSTAFFTITVTDDEGPTISDLPASFTLTNDADLCGGTAMWNEPTSADNCAVASFEPDIANGSLLDVGETTITYTSTDIHGHVTTAAFTVTVLDDQNPEFLLAPESQILDTELGLCGSTANWAAPTTSDNCEVLSLGSSHNSEDFFGTGTTEVTLTLTDVHNNITTHVFSITVNDVESPELIEMPSSISQTADPGLCGASVSWTPPGTSDNCPGELLSGSHQPGDFFAVGDTEVTYTVEDSSSNVVSSLFLVTVTDDEAPIFDTAPQSQSLGTDLDHCDAIATWDAPTGSDNCEVASLTSSHESGAIFLLGVTTVMVTLTDIHGQTTTHEFDILVSDDQAPEILGMPSSSSQSADPGVCGAVIEWPAPSATDNCPNPSLFTEHPSGSFFSVGTTLVTYIATDSNGLETTSSFEIAISDDELPSFDTTVADMELETDSGLCAATAIWDAPQTSDNCGVLSLGSDSPSGTQYPVGMTTVTMTLQDINGNVATHQFTITVSDTELPLLLGMPLDIALTNEPDLCGASASWTEPSNSDNCSIDIMSSTHSSGEFFPVGETTVTYSVTDDSGNKTAASFTITVNDDQAPEFDLAPVDMTMQSEPGECGSTAMWDAPQVSDNCGTTTLTNSHESGDFFNVGTTFVTLSLTDPSGNNSLHTFIVTVIDEEDPVIDGVPDDLSQLTDPGQCGANVNWAPPVSSDNCGLGELVVSHQPGEFFPVGTTTVIYSQADVNGNLVSAQFDVSVADEESPTIATSGNLTIPAPDGSCTATINIAIATATDNCTVVDLYNDQNGTDDASGTYNDGSTVILWTAIDNHGNITVVEQVVTIVVPQVDCNENGNPDVCDVAEGSSADCDGNGVPDECDLDCNLNGLPDACDVADGSSPDCNGNGVPDECDLESGSSLDTNANATPDECEPVFRRGDANDDAQVDIADAIFMLYSLMLGGPASGCVDATDANDDGLHDISDIIYVLNYQFQNGGPPPAPGPTTCGIDMTPDDGIGCDSYGVCP